jgi:hypothetical protein
MRLWLKRDPLLNACTAPKEREPDTAQPESGSSWPASLTLPVGRTFAGAGENSDVAARANSCVLRQHTEPEAAASARAALNSHCRRQMPRL